MFFTYILVALNSLNLVLNELMDFAWLLTDSFMYMRQDTNLSLVSIFCRIQNKS